MSKIELFRCVMQVSKLMLLTNSIELLNGLPVLYIPQHLMDFRYSVTLEYPQGAQPGFIYLRKKPDQLARYLPVRYWQYDYKRELFVPELRTVANSENSPVSNLFYYNMFGEKPIQAVMSVLNKEIE